MVSPVTKLVPRGAPIDEPALSPARVRLRDALAAHAKAEQDLRDVSAGTARLAEIEAAEAGVLGEIGALGRAEIARMTAWARSGEGEPPAPDAARRKTLAQRLADIQGKAAAARGAGETLETVRADLATKHEAASDAIDEAVVAVALEELEAVAQELADAEARATALHTRLRTLMAAVPRPASGSPLVARVRALEWSLDRDPEPRRLPSPAAFEGPARTVEAFLAQLRTDPAAAFEAA